MGTIVSRYLGEQGSFEGKNLNTRSVKIKKYNREKNDQDESESVWIQRGVLGTKTTRVIDTTRAPLLKQCEETRKEMEKKVLYTGFFEINFDTILKGGTALVRN